ncbi:hypothetical protein L6V77_21335 [Myxococcota bacterium]|nr:hypothetical protein [Myxococcota bacterium]
MLVDLHLTPHDLAPAALAQAAREAGLHGAVVTDTNRTDRLPAYLDALRQAGLAAYGGVELALDRGFLVFIPREVDAAFLGARWSIGAGKWDANAAVAACAALPGVTIAGHPYCRDLGSVLFDSVYTLPGLAAIETRVARGRPLWDAMADDVAARRKLPRIGSCGGDPGFVGRALTFVHGERLRQAALVDALRDGSVWPIEFEARVFFVPPARGRVRRAAPARRARRGRGRRRRRTPPPRQPGRRRSGSARPPTRRPGRPRPR